MDEATKTKLLELYVNALLKYWASYSDYDRGLYVGIGNALQTAGLDYATLERYYNTAQIAYHDAV